MRQHVVAWARPIAAVIVVALGLGFAAPPASAAEAAVKATPRPTIADSVDRATRAVPRAALMQDAPVAAQADRPTGFFGTTRGKIAAALFVGGVAWTIYSVKDSRDPVKSPIR